MKNQIKDATVDCLYMVGGAFLAIVVMEAFVLDKPVDWWIPAVATSGGVVTRIVCWKRFAPKPKKWYFGYLPKPLFRKKRQ